MFYLILFLFSGSRSTKIEPGGWKYELAKFKHCMITPNRRVQFEAWFQRKIFTFWDSIYQSWLVLKRASIGTDVEALDSILAEKIPKNLKKSKYKRNMNYPSGPARYDCTGPKWMELFKSRRQRKSEQKSKKSKDPK